MDEPLTLVQLDCLESHGLCQQCIGKASQAHPRLCDRCAIMVAFRRSIACVECPSNIWGADCPCKVRESDVVARLIDGTVPCEFNGCTNRFKPESAAARFCKGCRAKAYERHRDHTCPECSRSFHGPKKAKVCPDCRSRPKSATAASA